MGNRLSSRRLRTRQTPEGLTGPAGRRRLAPLPSEPLVERLAGKDRGLALIDLVEQTKRAGTVELIGLNDAVQRAHRGTRIFKRKRATRNCLPAVDRKESRRQGEVVLGRQILNAIQLHLTVASEFGILRSLMP